MVSYLRCRLACFEWVEVTDKNKKKDDISFVVFFDEGVVVYTILDVVYTIGYAIVCGVLCSKVSSSTGAKDFDRVLPRKIRKRDNQN